MIPEKLSSGKFVAPGVEVLVVEDSDGDALIVREELENNPLLQAHMARVARMKDALCLLAGRRFDVVLADLNLPDSTGLETFEALRAAASEIPLIVLSGLDDPQLAAQILRRGAQDYLTKGKASAHLLARSVRHAIERHRVLVELDRHVRRLAESEARVRNIIDSNADAVVIVDGDGIVRFVNPAAEQMFGRPARNFLGHSFGFPVASNGQGKTTELDVVGPDGTASIVGMRVTEIQWEGTPAFLASLRDITSRVKMELQLQDTLARLRAVVATPRIFLWALDQSGTIQVSEGKLLEKLGALPEQLVGKSIHELYRDIPQLMEVTTRALCGETIHENVDVGGHVVETWYSPATDGKGTLTGTIAVGIDVTERVRLEAQFRQAQKMEAVGRLAGGIAHDFNNLLTVIGSFAGLAIEQLEGLPSVRSDVQQIQQAAESAACLTSQLLAFSRRQIIQPRILDLNQEINRMGSMLQRLLGEDILLVNRFDRDLEKVKADPGQIEQVIMNLAVNARDAMPRGGRLTITTANQRLDAEFVSAHPGSAQGSFALIAVSDTGQGMDETTRRSVFEPFFTTKGIGQGTGLGLATVYGIVKQSGGSIWVESKPGQGATFNVYLPAVNAPSAPAMQEDESRGVSPGSETILVVEDQSAIRIAAQRMLERQGYRVLAAADPSSALRVAREYASPIHLLITDVVLPSASGRDLAKLLVVERPELRVIYMSGYMDDTTARHGILDARVAFLHKPFEQEMLTRKVREVLDLAEPPAI